MNVPKIQCCSPHKKSDKHYSAQSFGSNPSETGRPVREIVVELGDAIIRDAERTIKQVKKDVEPTIKTVRKKIKQAAKFASEKLADFAKEGEEVPKELPKQ